MLAAEDGDEAEEPAAALLRGNLPELRLVAKVEPIDVLAVDDEGLVVKTDEV